MNTLELVDYFQEITGRYDLTKVQIIRYLNQGQLYLDSIYSRDNMLSKYSVILPSFVRSFRIPNCIAVESLGYRTAYESNYATIKRDNGITTDLVKETGYGHFHGVTYSGNVILVEDYEGIKQDFLLMNFRIGQRLSLYSLGAGGQLAFDSVKVSALDGDPIITFVDSDQIICDRDIPDGGAQVAIVGSYADDTDQLITTMTFKEQTTAKRLNQFNIKSIVPSAFDGVIVLSIPLQANTEISALYQCVEPLLEDTDESWWSVNHAEILVSGAAYMLERWYRNMTAMKEWKAAIDEDLFALYSGDTKKRKIPTAQMNDSFSF